MNKSYSIRPDRNHMVVQPAGKSLTVSGSLPSPSTSVSKLVGILIDPAPNSALNSSITVPAASTHVSKMNLTRSFMADLKINFVFDDRLLHKIRLST